jgi:hypothetical protein
MMVKTEVKENLLAPGSTIASSYKLGKDFSTLIVRCTRAPAMGCRHVHKV